MAEDKRYIFKTDPPYIPVTEEWVEESIRDYAEFLRDKTKLFVQQHRDVVVAVCKKCGFRAGNLPYPYIGDVYCPKCKTFLYTQV